MRIKLPTFVCRRCGHRWHPTKPKRPARCAFCKSSAWDMPSDGSPQRRRHGRECVGCP